MEKDYRMVRLTDGTTIMGSIKVDKDFLRITNALELNTIKRETETGMKDDSTLARCSIMAPRNFLLST